MQEDRELHTCLMKHTHGEHACNAGNVSINYTYQWTNLCRATGKCVVGGREER